MMTHHLRLPRLALAAAAALSLAGCGGTKAQGTPSCTLPLSAGDLVVSELLANPAGADTGHEWFEIFSTLDTAVTLSGLQLVVSRADGSGARTHTVAALALPPRGYVALGDATLALRPAFIGYGYGSDLGSLPNTNGALTLKCGDQVIDRVVWADSTEGSSRTLDGARTPDGIVNDDVNTWCDASSDSGDGFLGTPGLANDLCGPVANTTEKGFCTDPMTNAPRDIRKPTAGQLVFSEVMADPLVADTRGEWVELTALGDFDLAGLAIGTDPKDLVKARFVAETSVGPCHPVVPGDRVVLVRSLDPTVNGGVQPGPLVFTLPVGLVNGGGPLVVASAGVVLDSVTLEAAKAGAARQLDPDRIDPARNDDPKSWCPAATDYGAGGKGTPGAANASCGIVEPGMCLEGAMARPKVAPQAGDLLIAEVMADPSAVADTKGEWFELKVTRDVDLNGLAIGADPMKLVAIPEGSCRRVTAGSAVLLVRNADPMQNGGLPAVESWQVACPALTNTGGALHLAYGGVAVDDLTWMKSAPGRSLARDPLDAVTWCTADALLAYGAGDAGTPGKPNPSCP